MEEIKVGEYVRTEKGEISKIVDNVISYTANGNKYNAYPVDTNSNSYITKHSPDIIDLIEVGDYVNGERVLYIDNCLYGGEKTIITELDKRIFDNMIKSIVTHEQFNSIKYVLGGKEE